MLTTCLLSSDRSNDDTLKITSSSFTKDVKKHVVIFSGDNNGYSALSSFTVLAALSALSSIPQMTPSYMRLHPQKDDTFENTFFTVDDNLETTLSSVHR